MQLQIRQSALSRLLRSLHFCPFCWSGKTHYWSHVPRKKYFSIFIAFSHKLLKLWRSLRLFSPEIHLIVDNFKEGTTAADKNYAIKYFFVSLPFGA